MSAHRFPKSGRLRGQRKIQELFKKGSSFYFQPFRMVVFKPATGQEKHEVLFSVSKRDFKKATDRNRVKRLMKEAYRLHQQTISNLPKLQIAYIYTGKQLPDFKLVEMKLIESFGHLKQYVEKI